MTRKYFIGRVSGNWMDNRNWSLTSGGAGGVETPGPEDAAVFDDRSSRRRVYVGTRFLNWIFGLPIIVDNKIPSVTRLKITDGYRGCLGRKMALEALRPYIPTILDMMDFFRPPYLFIKTNTIELGAGCPINEIREIDE